MKINGDQIFLSSPVSLADFLTERNYDISRVAVELNGEIVPKSKFSETFLKDSDEAEIVCFVGGG